MDIYLQTNSNFAVSERHQHVCHVGIASRSDEASSKLIASGGIETGSNCTILALLVTISRESTY